MAAPSFPAAPTDGLGVKGTRTHPAPLSWTAVGSAAVAGIVVAVGTAGVGTSGTGWCLLYCCNRVRQRGSGRVQPWALVVVAEAVHCRSVDAGSRRTGHRNDRKIGRTAGTETR